MTLSHRFKSSPSISGKVEIPGAAGYMMMAGHFSESHVSSGDLNRGRRTESRVLFGYFLHNAKSDKPFPFRGAPRFCKPQSSAQTIHFRINKIKSFRRLRRFYSKEAISRRNVKKNSVAVTDTAKKSATGSAKNTAKVLSAKKFGKI